MINGAKLLETIDEIVTEKQIDRNLIIESIKEGIKRAYEKHFDPEANILINFDEKTGQISVKKEYTVVKKVEDDLLEISLTEAKEKYGDNVTVGDKVYEDFDSSEFSRLAIIQVGQIIKQQIKEAEKNSIFDEYIGLKGELITGIVSADEEKYLLVEVGRTLAYIARRNLIYSDNYELGSKILFLVEDVVKSKNAGQIIGSRTSNEFLAKLLEREVPEIFEEVIEVKSIARDPGNRSKIAVYSNNPNIDPIGACIGNRGTRIGKVTSELNNEKIDICIYSDILKEFIINALSPVKVISIVINEELQEASIVVPDEQLSLAIGKKGIAVKLVAKLTKSKLNIINYSAALEQKQEILWNGNLTVEELEQLKRRLSEYNKSKPNFFGEKNSESELEKLPNLEELPIVEESIDDDVAEDEDLLDESDMQIDDLTEMQNNNGEKEINEDDLKDIEDNLLDFQKINETDDDPDEDIDYEDYEDYYDE